MVNIALKKEDKNKAICLIFCFGVIVMKWKNWIPYLVCFFLVIFIKQFIVTPVRVVGSSMDPTLKNGDIMLLDKMTYRFHEIKRFDIVVVCDHNTDIIKRVIGIPGEVVSFRDNDLYIDGKKIDQPFSYGDTKDFSFDDIDQTVIPKNHYFVVGDNRPDSQDSRMKTIGFIDKAMIEGKATFTIFPFSRFGRKK